MHLSFTEYQVEVYYLKFNLCTHSDESHMVKEEFSRATTIGKWRVGKGGEGGEGDV